MDRNEWSQIDENKGGRNSGDDGLIVNVRPFAVQMNTLNDGATRQLVEDSK